MYFVAGSKLEFAGCFLWHVIPKGGRGFSGRLRAAARDRNSRFGREIRHLAAAGPRSLEHQSSREG
jgi:hypothetical protein